MASEPEESRQRKQSESMLSEHASALAAAARDILAQVPDAELVGVVLSGDSSEAAAFKDFVRRTSDQVPPPGGVVTVLPRKMVVDLLKVNAPAMLEWLDSTPGRLPLVAATRDGHRLATVNLESGELDTL